MPVYPEQHDEYTRRHNPIWRELEKTLLQFGVRSYSIFLDPVASELFAYVEVESEEQWEAIAETEVCHRWWRHMRDVMPNGTNHRPTSQDLREVFHLEAPRRC
jgi:L-rhamnose mutarotase